MSQDRFNRFADIGFDDFRRMAQDDSLSRYEKIGFPNEYRAGKESAIFEDILSKLDKLSAAQQTVLDIGPGCSDLPGMLVELCQRQGHKLVLVDSAEMLAHIPDASFIERVPAYYPKCDELFTKFGGKVDVILCYSVLHYIFAESNLWEFLDRSLELLNHGGQMLIGDIPNVSKRKRFFSSPGGVIFHKSFISKDEKPLVNFHVIERKKIDDSVMLAIVLRARQAGFDAYIVPQRSDLPMANRREDLLIVRP
jgi:2-polyprenyl-3-methyl-5-hydroxy-6-metoxy-1,4-benzoquinol methylase